MKAVRHALDNFETYICYVLILVLVTLLSFQILNRYFFQTTFVWLEEIVRISFVWMIYFSVAAAARADAHVRVAVLDLICPPRVLRVVNVLADVLTIAFCGMIVWLGMLLLQSSILFGDRSPVTEIPMSVIYSVIPVCFGLIAVRTLQALLSSKPAKAQDDSAPVE